MANPYKEADNRKKTPPGGHSSEVKKEQPVVETEIAQAEAVEETPAVVIEQREAVEEKKTNEPAADSNTLASIYADKRKSEIEPRIARIQVVTTPSLAEKLKALDDAGIIKSRNDLINFLLESYMETLPEDLFEELLKKNK